MMATFEFTLKFSLPEAESDPKAYIELLAEAGCDDALVGLGLPGRIVLEFDRESASAFEAISSAIVDVRQAIPEAKLVEATPDLVGLTDIADIVQCSRQNMRKIWRTSITTFPAPIHEGKTALWRLASVLIWLRDNNKCVVEEKLLDIAETNKQLNLAREAQAIDAAMQKNIYALVQ